MAKVGDGMPSVREHADAVITRLVEQGNIKPDADAASLATGIPVFSKGTRPLDPNTGEPIGETEPTLPGFTEGTVAPEGDKTAAPLTEKEGVAGSGKSAEELLAEHRQRIAEGAPQEHAPPTQAAPIETQAPAQQAGAEAAEAAAQAVVDAFGEYEEFEFEDPDLDVKIPVRVPKQYAQSAKRGYGRRSAYDREMSWLKNAEALKPLVQDGRLNQLMPLIQYALADPDGYGAYVVNGYRRAQQGLPLIEQARQEAAAAGAPAVDLSALDPALSALASADPFTYEQLNPVLSPVLSRLQGVQERLDAQDAANRVAQQQQREEQQRNVQMANDLQAAHQDLARTYPDKTRLDLGAQDPLWQKALSYAREAGYVQAYGIRAGVIFGAQQVAQIEAERLAATASPAATALAATEQQNLELARRQAAQASRAVGGGAPTQAAPPPKPPAPSPRKADGTMKTPEQFLREQQAYLAATR